MMSATIYRQYSSFTRGSLKHVWARCAKVTKISSSWTWIFRKLDRDTNQTDQIIPEIVYRLTVTLLIYLSTTPLLQANIVEPILSGTSYEGGPEYSIDIGDQEFLGPVENVLDSNLAQENNFTFSEKHCRSIELRVSLIFNIMEINISFLNDSLNGDDRDYNLYIISTKVDGNIIKFSDFSKMKSLQFANRKNFPILQSEAVFPFRGERPDGRLRKKGSVIRI